MTTIRFWILDFGFWIINAKSNFAEIFGKSLTQNTKNRSNPKSNESGATLIGLMALMAIIAILLLAVAPNIQQQIEREREREAVRRGDEIAEAIRIYAQVKGTLPKNMDDLLEGIQIRGRTKKLMILRESAAHDPLSSSGEWKLIRANDFKTLANFQRQLSNYTGSSAFSNPEPRQVFDPLVGQIISTINTDTSEEVDPPGGEDDSENIDAPFVGVVSRAQTKAVTTYYGIERHDWWVFTPLFRGAGNGQNNIPNGKKDVNILDSQPISSPLPSSSPLQEP